MKRFLSLYKNVVLKHHSDNHMRGGAGDYRSIGQVSGEWWSVFHFRSLAIFKIRRKKNCPSAIVQNRFDICLKAHFILLLLVSREKCVQKKVFELITRWSQNYYWVKKVCWLFISWVTVTQLLKGARAPWLLIPQAEIEPAPPNLQKQFVYFTGMPGDEFFSRSGSTMEKAQVQFCRLEFDVDKRVEGNCILLELDLNKLWFDGKNVKFFISKNNFRFRAVVCLWTSFLRETDFGRWQLTNR